MATAGTDHREALRTSEIRAGICPRRVSEQAPGTNPRIQAWTAGGFSDRRTDHFNDPETAGLRQHRDDRADSVCDVVCGGWAADSSFGPPDPSAPPPSPASRPRPPFHLTPPTPPLSL